MLNSLSVTLISFPYDLLKPNSEPEQTLLSQKCATVHAALPSCLLKEINTSDHVICDDTGLTQLVHGVL